VAKNCRTLVAKDVHLFAVDAPEHTPTTLHSKRFVRDHRQAGVDIGSVANAGTWFGKVNADDYTQAKAVPGTPLSG
jgi:hypothetical protein